MLMPYATLTLTNPFLNISVLGVNFSSITGSPPVSPPVNNPPTTQTPPTPPATYVSVYRMFDGAPEYPPYNTPVDEIDQFPDTPPNDPIGTIYYFPIQYTSGNNFTFVIDNQIFSQGPGRYKVDLYYLSNFIVSLWFIYSAQETAIVPMSTPSNTVCCNV